MKRFAFSLVAVALLTTSSICDDSDKTPWLDMQNCSMCKPMGDNMDMMATIVS